MGVCAALERGTYSTTKQAAATHSNDSAKRVYSTAELLANWKVNTAREKTCPHPIRDDWYDVDRLFYARF